MYVRVYIDYFYYVGLKFFWEPSPEAKLFSQKISAKRLWIIHFPSNFAANQWCKH